MSKIRFWRFSLPARAWLLCGLLAPALAWAQQQWYWVGGSGAWNDADHWSLVADGPGGAGVPRSGDAVVIAPPSGPVVVTVRKDATMGHLLVDGTRASVAVEGAGTRLRIGGDMEFRGSVAWDHAGPVELTNAGTAQLHLRGIPLKGDLLLSGGGTWAMQSDLVLDDRADVHLRAGTLDTRGNMLRAGRLEVADRGAGLRAGSSVVMLARAYAPGRNPAAVEAGASRLLVGGSLAEWGAGDRGEDLRAINVCATGVGQTPFTIDAQLMSDYNGFGVSCHGVCNGSVRVVVTGGIGPFTYTWVGGPTTAQWNNVCPGNQIVIVTDQGQGVSCATTVQVTDPSLLSVIFTGTQPPTCAGVCNGSSTVFAVGGVPGYTYSWNSGAGTGASYNALCPGSNTLHVTDANGCAFDTTFNFPIQPIQPNLTTTEVQCHGDCDGTASVAPVGGTGAFSYDWGPGTPAGDGTAAVTGLCAGSYTVTISDANGCDTTLQFQIVEPPPIIPNPAQVDASCASSCDGSATVAPTGGSGTYTFSWSPAPGGGGTSATATGLCEGSYAVTITDAITGCDTVVVFLIEAPPSIVPMPSSTDVSCVASCDGTASGPATGGSGALTYTWTPTVTGQGSPHATELCPGTYSLLISDAAGCDTTLEFIIHAPPPIEATPVLTDVSCAGGCDGSITAPATGGTGTLTYAWVPAPPQGQGTPTASQLCAGTWSLTISDDNGCDTTLQFTIVEPPPLTATASQTDVTCGAACDGTAEVTVSGGSAGYTYGWSPAPPQGQGTPAAAGLCAGTWTVTITDANGCELVEVFEILPADPIVATVTTTPISCANACDGAAVATATGGVPDLSYVWSPEPLSGQGTPNATGLCAGPGTLTITDAAGCDTTIAFLIDAPPPIQVASTVTDASCFGACDGAIDLVASGGTAPFTYVWTPASAGSGASVADLCPGDYQVLVSSGGCDTTLLFTITQPPAIDVALATTPTNCADACDATATISGDLTGLNFNWSPAPGAGQGTATASGLCAIAYAVTISNAAGCDTVIAFTISAPPPLVPALDVQDASCGTACDGSATASFTGGTPGVSTYFWAPEPGTGQGTPNAGGLCPGDYTVTITDGAGCDTTLAFTILRPTGLEVLATSAPASCANTCDGSITATANGGVPPYSWTWSPEPGSGQGTPMAGGLCPGTWTVTVADQAGCDTTLNFLVTAPQPIEPNGSFTPESCNGPCDGTATVAPTGGGGGYSYAWSPAPPVGAGTASVSGLCAGDWCVTITDATGCDTTWCFTILPSSPIEASVLTVDGPCWDECVGEATVIATGGSGSYSYHWAPEPGAGQGSATATGLCQGPGTVTVTDIAGCDTTLAFIIFKNPEIVPNLTVLAETCAASCTGEASLSPVGGGGAFTYLWAPEPATGQGTNAVTGLCAGVDYTVTIEDINGCDTTVVFTVPPFTPVTATLELTMTTCVDDCDGMAVLAGIAGGVPPYSQIWSPEPPNGQGGLTATGLCPGDYQVTVSDANDCLTTIDFSITGPGPITVDAVLTPIGCGGQCTGAIDLTASGANGGFTYVWSPEPGAGQGTANVSQLCPGDWTVTITDVGGCDTTITYSLVEPDPLVATVDVTESHCGTCDGSALLQVTGGVGPYVFQWGAPLNLTTTDSLLTGLCAGVYAVEVTDASGCSVVLSVAISDADGEVVEVTDGLTSCPGDCDGTVSVSYACALPPCTVEWSDLLGNSLATGTDVLTDRCAGSYLVAVTNAIGCVTVDTALVTEPAPLTADLSSTPTSCAGSCDGTATIGMVGGSGPFTYTWSPEPGGGQGTPQATGLCAGSYEVFVQDQGGCSATFQVLILAPDPLAANATVTEVSCAGDCDGGIALDVQGGTGAYTYTWSPVPAAGQGTATASGLCPGTWSVTVADANGCDTTLSFTLTDPAPLSLSATTTESHCTSCDGTIVLAVNGGTAPATVQWTSNGNPAGTGDTLTGICAGVYVAQVTDAHGCIAQHTAVVSDATGEAITAVDGQTSCAGACDGAVSVAYICSEPPCIVTWFDMGGNQLAQGQDTLSGLCSGLYLVQVMNAAGCASTDTAQVTPAQAITPNLSTTPVSCPDGCDGTATVGPTGGEAPYTFTWEPTPGGGQGTPQATGLCPGTYQVTIADVNGCDTVVNVLITAPPPITVAAQVEQVSCNGACDGSIVLAPAGGNGFYSYVWSPMPPNGPGSNAAFGLCPGEWTVTVADLNGCDTTLTFTIQEPDTLTAAITTASSTCGICDGTAEAMPTGGTAPYAFTWTQNGTVLGTDSALTGLCAGLYAVQITDDHGCQLELTVPVDDLGGEALEASDDALTCPTDCDGEVSVTFNCTEPPCTTAWFDGAGNDLNEPGNTLSGLCAGSYFVQVTNGLGCISIDTAHVIAPDPILPNLSTTSVSCAGACDGTATVGPTGGAGGYSIEWDLGTGTPVSGPQVTGLCAGSYQVTITDADGCSVIQDVLILSPPPITAMAVVVPVTCQGACDGSITVVGQGGTGVLSYHWTPEPPNGQGSNTVTGLCADDWTLTITDANGCDTTFTLTLTDPPLLTVDLTHTDNICFDDCVATAHAEVAGGVPPYAISWQTVDGTLIDQDVTDVLGLCGGDYLVTVTDARGCELATPFTVGAGAPLEANLSFLGESCNGPCDGSASVSPTGGTGSGYTFLWQPGNPTGQGTSQVSGLCPGNWTVTITDDAGCDSTFAFTIAPFAPIVPSATVEEVACNGDCDGRIDLLTTGGVGPLSYQWTPEPGSGQGTGNVAGLCPGDWAVTITDAAGCDTTVTYSITEPPALLVTVDAVVPASCNTASDGAITLTISGGTPGYDVVWTGPDGFSSNDEDLSDLSPGSYAWSVTDQHNCVVSGTVDVAALNTVQADAGADRTVCSGVAIILDGSASQGAASFTWLDGQGTTIGTDAVVDAGDLPDGTYTFVLQVADGACVDSDTLTITVLPTPIADAGADRSIYLHGTTVLGGSPAGPPGSTFSWQPDSLLDQPDGPNPTATVSQSTWFHLTVIGPDGCIATDSVLVTVVPEVKVPSGFTPNGDGHNDTWVLDFADLFPGIEVQVFSRWGEPLFHSVGYAVPWDGKYDGQVVPMGTYYYVVELHDERFPEALTGPLTVIR